jgi:histidinol-phosphatase (PHP family)
MRACARSSLLTCWREEGGQAVSFGSDAHDRFTIGHQFTAAVDFAQAAGFGPARSGRGLWERS